MSGVAVYKVGMDARGQFGDSTLTGAEIFNSLPVGSILRTYMKYSIAVCSRLEATSQVISGRCMWPTVPDKCVKFPE